MDKCYYGFLKDTNELCNSSSGGFGASIAKYAIQKDGILYGVSYTSDFKNAEFIRVTSKGDIQKLLGSKYIYADNSQIKTGGRIYEDIQSGRRVFLIGLPCNIAGVLAILQKKGIEARNLITIDLVCGGATPAEVEKQYIEYLEKKYKSRIIDFSVRYKNPNWTPPYLRAVFENGKVFCKEFYLTEFGYTFEHMKRNACYDCQYKGDNHLSDITLGDAWGINKDNIGYNEKGVSVAFVHTENGNILLKELEDIVLFETESEYMKSNNPRYLTPKQRYQNTEKFREDLLKYGLRKACKKAWGIKRCLVYALPGGTLKLIRQLKSLYREAKIS